MQRKEMPIVVTDLAPRVLRFIGSDETEDRAGDVVSFDGWEIDNYTKNPVVLFNHDSARPVGKAQAVRLNRLDKRLEFDVYFPEVKELASDGVQPSEHALFIDTIYNLYKGGFLSAVSVGFKGKKAVPRDGSWGMKFESQELLELSLVSVPANPNALVTAKGLGLHTEIIPMMPKEEKSGARLSRTSRGRLEKLVKELREVLDEDMAEEQEAGCQPEEEKAATVEEERAVEPEPEHESEPEPEPADEGPAEKVLILDASASLI